MRINLTKEQRKAIWMSAFSDAVLKIDIQHAGRIDWATATHFFFQGMQPDVAAGSYCANRPEGPNA